MRGLDENRRPWVKRGGRVGALAVSLAAHAAIGVALVAAWTIYPAQPEQNPIAVSLVEAPRVIPPAPPALTVTPAKAAAPSAAVPSPEPAPAPIVSRPSPAPPQADSPPTAASATRGQGAGLSDSELAGASSADAGGGGGACHMAQRVQAALRRDALVQEAVAEAGRDGDTGAIMIWNGDWVQSPSQDGKGLAAVREAIMWEVAFAPEACRTERMRGLVLLSLNSAHGVPRLAVGAGDWRWSDLLVR